MKKKLAATLSVVLILGLATLGILAYLTDQDSDVNVMTLGNVKIEQIEQERNDAGELVDFTQAKPAYPAVGPVEWANNGVEVNGVEYKVFTDDLKNVVDKIVTVKNTGKSDAYVRTIVAIEAPEGDPNNLIHFNWNSTGVKMNDGFVTDINGVTYYVVEFVYNEIEKPEETSVPSLMQLFLDSKATNDDCAKFGATWDVLVVSQAVQTAGFDNAQTALDTAFGNVTDENAAKWFGGMVIPVVVETAAEFEAALANGDVIVLADDITLTDATTVDNAINLNLNGHKLTTSGLDLTKGGSVENGTITSGVDTRMTPHLKISGGIIEMDNVTVDVKHTLNANVSWTEATGMEVMNATAVLNNCDISIHNGIGARWVYSYGISVNNAEVTMNGGSVTATCVAGTAGNGPTNPNAICSMGDCTVTMNDVDVIATYYGTTVNGHLTINTTDKTITSANMVDNSGGSHTLNYID